MRTFGDPATQSLTLELTLVEYVPLATLAAIQSTTVQEIVTRGSCHPAARYPRVAVVLADGEVLPAHLTPPTMQ